MSPSSCPRCAAPTVPGATTCAGCGLDLAAPWAPGPPVGGAQTGWGTPQPDQAGGKALWLGVGCALLILVVIGIPVVIFALTASSDAGPFGPGGIPFPTFPPDFPGAP
jgi:hypothetical protein